MFKKLEITNFKLAFNRNLNADLEINFEGVYPSSGYTNLMLIPKLYDTNPKDGIYEFYCIANSPNDIVILPVIPFEDTFIWFDPPQDLKGVKIGNKIATV